MSAPHKAARDEVAEAARRSVAREKMRAEVPEPSLSKRLGQIGVLGWIIVGPMLLGVVLGRLADTRWDTGIFFTAPAIMIGAVLGLYSAWKWMHRQ